MAQHKRKRKKKKLRVLPRAFILQLAKDWEREYRERHEERGFKPIVRKRIKKRLAKVRKIVDKAWPKPRPKKPVEKAPRMRPPRPMAWDQAEALASILRERVRGRPVEKWPASPSVKPTVQEIASVQGIRPAIDAARYAGVTPDVWAEDVMIDFDLIDQHDMFEEFFYPPEGASAF